MHLFVSAESVEICLQTVSNTPFIHTNQNVKSGTPNGNSNYYRNRSRNRRDSLVFDAQSMSDNEMLAKSEILSICEIPLAQESIKSSPRDSERGISVSTEIDIIGQSPRSHFRSVSSQFTPQSLYGDIEVSGRRLDLTTPKGEAVW